MAQSSLADPCGRPQRAPHLAPEWTVIKEKRRQHGRDDMRAWGMLVLSQSSIFLHDARTQHLGDRLHFYTLALRCATRVLCALRMSPVSASV